MLAFWLVTSASLLQIQAPTSRLYAQAFLERYGATGTGTLSDRAHREVVVRALGFGGVRVLVGWDDVERTRGVRAWGRVDSIFDELQRDSLQALGLLAYSPRWAVPAQVARLPRSNSHRPVVDGSTSRGDTLFASFAAAAARRYRGRVNRWEVWNEENHPFFWFNVAGDSNQGPSARDYVALFSLARDSILAGNPQAEVAVGGLASFSGHVRPVADPLRAGRAIQALPPHMFLREVLKMGVKPRAVGIHPYSVLPPGKLLPGEGAAVFPDLVVDSVAAVLDAFALSSTTLWVTEWGVDAKPTMDQSAVTSWYEAGLNSLLCNRRIVFVTLHALSDPDPATHFGLLNDDGSDARDGVAFRDFLSHWAGCASR